MQAGHPCSWPGAGETPALPAHSQCWQIPLCCPQRLIAFSAPQIILTIQRCGAIMRLFVAYWLARVLHNVIPTMSRLSVQDDCGIMDANHLFIFVDRTCAVMLAED